MKLMPFIFLMKTHLIFINKIETPFSSMDKPIKEVMKENKERNEKKKNIHKVVNVQDLGRNIANENNDISEVVPLSFRCFFCPKKIFFILFVTSFTFLTE